MRKKNSKLIPPGFEEVILSRATGWSYWELVLQPAWFIDKLMVYLQAENIVSEIEEKKIEMEAKKYHRPLRGISRFRRYGRS